jgi:hypothetical protein
LVGDDDDLDELMGYVAAEANHEENRRRRHVGAEHGHLSRHGPRVPVVDRTAARSPTSCPRRRRCGDEGVISGWRQRRLDDAFELLSQAIDGTRRP